MTSPAPVRPLDGFRVLDFTQNVAGPLAGQVLVDLGAEVIKIEAPGGEAARRITSVLPGRAPLATYFLPNNRGKKSVMVDLGTTEGKEAVLRLADTADVVLEAFRPGVMEKLGLGPDALQERNRRLVYARLSAYGGNGANSSRPGLDLMVQAEAGMTTGMRRPNGAPQIIPFQLVDGASGHVLAQAVLAALLNRERHGIADVVKVAMYDVAVSLQANQLTLHLNKNPKPDLTTDAPRLGADGKPRKQVAFATQPSEAFEALDGFVVLSAYVPKHWAKLCEVIGRPELTTDTRFIDQRARSVNFEDLKIELEVALAAKTAAEWVDLLRHHGLMATLAYNWKQVIATPLFAENELAVTTGDVKVIRTPARYGSFQAAGDTPPPDAGQHNDEFLSVNAGGQ
ncbi:CoA transferase [Mycolicibacterium phocaicum]|uniref:CoA transferase n=1 Tax=Mycolicibacterium phocaicum TaxID=319706 RepID=UPI00092AFA3E|nr:CoA transferase [Mycolicibacterium phocaicum]UCZ62493.1 CoA transferase [Mycolicibacterium phocaicum]SHT67932.1 acyl-CoA transferase [Mycobacteroides abscessus subsp. abscessus]